MIKWIKDNIGGFWDNYPVWSMIILGLLTMVIFITFAMRGQMDKANGYHDRAIKIEWIDYDKKIVVGEIGSKREIITGVIDFGKNIPFVGETWRLNQNGLFVEFNERLK